MRPVEADSHPPWHSQSGEESNPYLRAIEHLNQSGVPYVIVGGFSVLMHGVGRFTQDLNAFVDLGHPNLPALLERLMTSGLRVEPGYDMQGFLDQEQRKRWHADGKKWFFVLDDPQAPPFSLQLFLEGPIPFSDAARDAELIGLGQTNAVVCHLEALLEMKRRAGRGQDRQDVENLLLSQSLAARLNAGASEEELLAGADQAQANRMADLVNFRKLSHEERADWLMTVLTQLGSFCAI